MAKKLLTRYVVITEDDEGKRLVRKVELFDDGSHLFGELDAQPSDTIESVGKKPIKKKDK